MVGYICTMKTVWIWKETYHQDKYGLETYKCVFWFYQKQNTHWSIESLSVHLHDFESQHDCSAHLFVVMLFTVLAGNCCREAVTWYYRILESNASRERSRLGIDDISVSVLPSCGHNRNSCLTNTKLWLKNFVCFWSFPGLTLIHVWLKVCFEVKHCCLWCARATGSFGEWSFPLLSGGLLPGDFHMLIVSVMWLPSGASHPQPGSVPFLEGVSNQMPYTSTSNVFWNSRLFTFMEDEHQKLNQHSAQL